MPAPVLHQGQNGTRSLQDVLQSMYYDLRALPTYTVAQLPTPASNSGALAYCSNGAAGTPAIVYCNGTAWKVVAALGATAAIS